MYPEDEIFCSMGQIETVASVLSPVAGWNTSCEGRTFLWHGPGTSQAAGRCIRNVYPNMNRLNCHSHAGKTWGTWLGRQAGFSQASYFWVMPENTLHLWRLGLKGQRVHTLTIWDDLADANMEETIKHGRPLSALFSLHLPIDGSKVRRHDDYFGLLITYCEGILWCLYCQLR